jgi:hypothetical protein
MELSDVHARMKRLGFFFPSRLQQVNLLAYQKLAYAIGQGLDEEMSPWFLIRCVQARALLNKDCEIGKRYHATYCSDGDETWDSIRAKEDGLKTYKVIVADHLPEWDVDNSDSVFTIFKDENHDNIVPFYRIQEFGNCFIQGPILLHWYLSLWNDKTKKPDDVKFTHLSKFVRNALSSKELFAYIFEDLGGNSTEMAKRIFSWPSGIHMAAMGPTASFKKLRDTMKKAGPALVEMTHTDLHNPKKFRYSSKPEGKAEGHALVLVGVLRRDETNKVFFLMQNFWEGKQFLELRSDYFSDSEGEFFPEPNCQSADIYSQKAGTVRFAKSSSLLERADQKVEIRLRQGAN